MRIFCNSCFYFSYSLILYVTSSFLIVSRARSALPFCIINSISLLIFNFIGIDLILDNILFCFVLFCFALITYSFSLLDKFVMKSYEGSLSNNKYCQYSKYSFIFCIILSRFVWLVTIAVFFTIRNFSSGK